MRRPLTRGMDQPPERGRPEGRAHGQAPGRRDRAVSRTARARDGAAAGGLPDGRRAP